MTRNELRDSIFWLVTLLHSALGTCDRLRTASSAEKDKRLLGFGYNGSLPGEPHCDEAGHLIIDNHCERTRHGETNLRLNTRPEDLRGAAIRIIATPCLQCVRDELISAGVTEVRYAGAYHNARGRELVEELATRNGIPLKHCDIDWVEALQTILDKLAEPGGLFHTLGFRVRLVKEPL